jgi:hypothetical protein
LWKCGIGSYEFGHAGSTDTPDSNEYIINVAQSMPFHLVLLLNALQFVDATWVLNEVSNR